jgi:short-subunit dehydrogenase
LKKDASITLLVNNAGTGTVAPLLSSDVDKMDEMISLNIRALTRLTYAVVPGFVTRGTGTIINISSIVAVAPELLNGVYGGTKAFVLAFSHSLQHELAAKGIRIQAVRPGAIATEFWDLGGYPVSNFPPEFVMTTEDLVDAALSGLDQGELVTIPALPDKAEWDRFEGDRRPVWTGRQIRAGHNGRLSDFIQSLSISAQDHTCQFAGAGSADLTVVEHSCQRNAQCLARIAICNPSRLRPA